MPKPNSTGKPDKSEIAKSEKLRGERLSEAETRKLLESLRDEPKRKSSKGK